MSRKWTYWPLFLARNFYGFGLLGMILYAGCALVGRNLLVSHPDLPKVALGLFMIIGPAGGFLWLRRRDIDKANALLDGLNPLKLTLDDAGIHTLDKKGARTFSPWSSFDGFREGNTVILLRDSESRQNRVIAKKIVPSDALTAVQSMIRKKLPEIH